MTATNLKPAAKGRIEAMRRRRAPKAKPDGAADQDHGARVLHALTAARKPLNLQQLHVATGLTRGDLVYVLPMLCNVGKVGRTVGNGGRYVYAIAAEPLSDKSKALAAHAAAIGALKAYAAYCCIPQLTRLTNTLVHTFAQCEITGD